MTASGADRTMPPARIRRAAAPFRRVTVQRVERLSPRMVRVTLGGPELAGFTVEQPAASVRLLLPRDGATDGEIELPTWDRNNFVEADGRRPTLRTFTPLRFDAQALELDLEIVVHGDGPASVWAESAEIGTPTALSGPARGYSPDESASDFVVVGDETAIPAVSQLLEALPQGYPVRVVVEVAEPEAQLPLPDRPGATIEWTVQSGGDRPAETLVAAVVEGEIGEATRFWAAGEAAAMQAIRRHLFAERGVPRAHTWIRGYWKHGRSGDESDTDDA